MLTPEHSVWKIIKKRLGAILLLGLFVGLAMVLLKGLKLDPRNIPSALINQKLPEFDLPELELSTHLTAKQWLGKPALINVWASWCVSCINDHDVLMQLAHQSKNVVIYGLNYKDDQHAAKQWLALHGNPFKQIACDLNGKTAIDWGVYGTPETFVIDKNGIIRYKQIGPMTMQIWEKQIKPLLESLS